MPSSMTGFGAAEASVGSRIVRAEVRSVNHRFFNFTARLPGDLTAFETEARDLIRRDLDRGHVTLSVRWIDELSAVRGIDWAGAEAAVTALRAVRDRFALDGDVTVEMVTRYADLFAGRRESGDAPAVGWELIAPVVAEATAACKITRQREGEILGAALAGHLAAIEASAGRIAIHAPARVIRERDRLRAQVAQLLEGQSLPEQRIAEEIALLADRLDITEELVRLEAHVGAARLTLGAATPVGKQLGFLAQEMGREVNTIGSKANDAPMAHEVVAMKGELEKFREQLENLE